MKRFYLRLFGFAFFAVLALTTAVFASQAAAATAYPPKVGYPNSIASTGDSITRAFNTGTIPFKDAPQNSWSSGTSGIVQSHYVRILAAHSEINGKTYNDAKTGAQMDYLNTEVSEAVSQKAEYVTILMGANDACTDTVDSMTPVDTYRSELETALHTLSSGLPDTRIYLASVPNVYHLWEILHDNLSADSTWSLFNICQSLLVNPRSNSQEDEQRRQQVLQRIKDYNTQLQQACAEYIHCRFDNNAVFNYQFVPSQVNKRDYFHPNISGQTELAAVTYAATFDFTDMVSPISTASVTPVPGGANVTLSATDNKGVSGIEYQLGSSAIVRYTAPVFVPTGSTLIYRAVDVNGNIEASHSITP